MRPRERVLNALLGAETDRLVWAPLIDGYYLSYLSTLGLQYDVVQCLQALDADVIVRHLPFYKTEFSGGVEFLEKRSGNDAYTEITTPVGKLSQIIKMVDGSETCIEYLIKGREDLKIFQYVEEHKHITEDYQAYLDEDRKIGDAGIGTASVASTPLATLYEFYMGLENFVYFLNDYPGEMGGLMAAIHENARRHHLIAAQSPAPAVIMYEDTSTTTISRELYINHCKSQMDEYADIVHGEGKPYYVHMCGKLRGFADLLAGGRMDGVESVCPPETGDVWPWEAVGLFGNKRIIGGVDPSWLCFASLEEIESRIMYTIKKVKQTGKVILCTGDATAYGTPMENLRLVSELVKKFG